MRPPRKRPIALVQPAQLTAVVGGATAAPKPKEQIYLTYELKDALISSP